MELSASSVASEIKKFELPIGFLGFWAGADQKWENVGGNPGTGYPYNEQGFGDMLAGVGGADLARSVVPKWSGGATRQFKIMNPLTKNKALVPLIGLILADKFAGTGFGPVSKVIRIVADAGVPFALGYSIGTVFDSDSPGNEGTPRAGSVYGAPVAGHNGQWVIA